MVSLRKSLIELINEINIEDLQYIETDLCFYELVALGFLLYGDDRSGAQFILQRLIILSQHPPQGKGLAKNQKLQTSDILRKYANFNRQTWRLHVVEALAIIRAKKVLRRLGLTWRDIDHNFLPHIAEISVHIHPLLKALYIIAERLTPDKMAKLINEVNMKFIGSENLRFYDFSFLEIFLLNWLSKGVIKIESGQLRECNVEVIIEYFKNNDMQEMMDMLLEIFNQNWKSSGQTDHKVKREKNSYDNCKDSVVSMSQATFSCYSLTASSSTTVDKTINEFGNSDRYSISRKNAGYILILNQIRFYRERDPKLQHLLPSIQDVIPERKGTNIDRDKLQELFTSFGYIPLVFENLTHLEILHKIRETAQKSLLKDSLIVCILSHGMEGVVLGCNTIPVAINEIKEILTTDTLRGKPKMLIIQACQRNISTVDTKNSSCIRDFSPDAFADIILAMSSIPGTDALRHTTNGSWFVESLCQYTQKLGDRKHMLDILTAVICDISKRKSESNQVMLPTTSSTMRKDFYLPSRV